MMDWFKKNQEMMTSWMETQQKMMNSMMPQSNTLADVDSPMDYDRMLRTWETSFKNMMETQTLMTRMWARNMAMGMPAEAGDNFVKSVEQMTQTWTEMQSMMMTNWFSMMRDMNPAQMQDMPDDAVNAMEAWQSNMQKMMESGQEWTQKWMSMMSASDDK